MLDSLATRYHLLPSEVLVKADTLDYVVMDVAIAFQHYQHQREDAKRRGLPPPVPNLPINTLQDMLDRVRDKNS